MVNNKKSTIIDGICATENRDIQNEVLNIAGADISDLEQGKGLLNDNHAAGYFNTIGHVISAKKIFKAEDCEDERQKYYWEKTKSPYIYFKGELFDNEDHNNAKAAAAILRNIHKKDLPIRIKTSVEGGVISRGIKDPSFLEKTKISKIALTFTPANRATLIEPLNVEKSIYNPELDEALIKSVMHLIKEDVPSFIDISNELRISKIKENIEAINSIVKAVSKKKDNNELEKGLKEGIASGAAALSLFSSPVNIDQDISDKNIEHHHIVDAIKEHNPLLWAISQVESSGGKNLKHKTINRGINAGHNAGGPWGLTPHTVSYLYRNDKDFANKYPEIENDVNDVSNNHSKITERLNNDPVFALHAASSYLNRANKMYSGNMDKVIHSWKAGLKGTNNAIQSGKNLRAHKYVQAVRNKLKEVKKSLFEENDLNKALTAGYGGANAPGSRVGGNVIMVESLLGSGKKDFKRTKCPLCGKEQILTVNQLRCRECGKNWNFNKLAEFIGNDKKN